MERGASDLFLVSGYPLAFKRNNRIEAQQEKKLTPQDTDAFVKGLYELAGDRSLTVFLDSGDDDFSFSLPDLGRFRCNVYRQRGSMAAVLRVVAFSLPDPEQLHIPQTVMDLSEYQRGLVLITGSAGSGKSTTLACVIDKINHSRNSHIITIEDPIEFLHTHDKSIVSQREVSHDTTGYVQALRAALRQAPNVILLGEMRDYETIATAMTAAETGQLVLSTLHTVGAANTIDRIIDVFPSNQQQQIRVQLSMVLQAVVSQQLIPARDGGLVPAFEILQVNPAVRTMIRESRIHQIDNVIASGAAQGMCSMDASLQKLFGQGAISRENALFHAVNPDLLARKLS